MFIRKLRPGEQAPGTADRVYIGRVRGEVSWTGSVKIKGSAVVRASAAQFTTVQEAETDAIAWARSQGVTKLQIEGPPL